MTDRPATTLRGQSTHGRTTTLPAPPPDDPVLALAVGPLHETCTGGPECEALCRCEEHDG